MRPLCRPSEPLGIHDIPAALNVANRDKIPHCLDILLLLEIMGNLLEIFAVIIILPSIIAEIESFKNLTMGITYYFE